MLIYMGVRRGLKKLRGIKNDAEASKTTQPNGTQEEASRSKESLDEDGIPKEVKKA